MPDWFPSLHTIIEWVVTWCMLSLLVAALWARIGWMAWKRKQQE